MKNQRFWALPWLCLCLVSCSVFRGPGPVKTERKGYQLTVALALGDDRSALFAVIDPGSMQVVDEKFFSGEGALTLHLIVNSQDQLNAFRDRLNAAGIRVLNFKADE